MNSCDVQYAGLLSDLLTRGERVATRNAEVRRLLGREVRFESTPLVSLRRTSWRTALREMEWFMSGSDNINDAHPSVRPWWQPWADPGGRILNSYGAQFRHFHGRVSVCDQIGELVCGVRHHPFSRRNVISTWNAADMADPATPITNCHGTGIVVSADTEGRLHLFMSQRSADVIVGLTANWVQYWAFLLWLACRTARRPGSFVWFGWDCHLYGTHADLARRIVAAADGRGFRTGERETVCESWAVTPGPELVYRPAGDGAEFRAGDFNLSTPYEPVITERAEMVV